MAALWKEQNKRQGARTDLTSAGRPAEVDTKTGPTRVHAIIEFNVSRWKVDQATKVRHAAPELFEKVYRGEMKLGKAYQIVKNSEQTQKVPEMPSGRYQVIYADPPWPYNNSGLSGSAENHYPTMSIEDLLKRRGDIESRVTDNAVLFLWVTSPFLPEGLKLCHEWGFEYKTSFVWIKDKSTYGKLGFYNYSQHEFLFVATRGSCLPRTGSLVPSLIIAPKGEHSAKPEEVYEIIEAMYPGPYLELFARKKRGANWEAWGTL